MKKAELKKANKKQEELLKEQKNIIKSYKKLLKEQEAINKKLRKSINKLNGLVESFFVDEELTDEELDYFLQNFDQFEEEDFNSCCEGDECEVENQEGKEEEKKEEEKTEEPKGRSRAKK